MVLVASVLNNNGAMYSLPINATPASDAALEIKMMQLMAKAMEGCSCIFRRSENPHADDETNDDHGKREQSKPILLGHGLKIGKKHSNLDVRNQCYE